jgi:hypothetical protein
VHRVTNTNWLTLAHTAPHPQTDLHTLVKIDDQIRPDPAGKVTVDLQPSTEQESSEAVTTELPTPPCDAPTQYSSVYAPSLRNRDFRMAAAAILGRAVPSPGARLSISTSPSSSTSSSDSPRTATTFSFSVRYMNNGSPPSPSSDDVVPKVEEMDDDDELIDAKAETSPEESNEGSSTVSRGTSNAPLARRPRGRPRKHPKTSSMSNLKQPKGRSKTGCITCRRRKKKCDETKPACMLPNLISVGRSLAYGNRSALPEE